MLCYCTLTFRILHVENLKCKNFLIDFLDELGNFKQKKCLHFKMELFFADFRALSIVNHRGGSGVIYHGALIWDLFEILKCSQHQ